MPRDVEEGASGPEAFDLLLRRLMTHFDRVDTGEGYTRLHSVCTATPFCDLSLLWYICDPGYESKLVNGNRWAGETLIFTLVYVASTRGFTYSP